ncbi:AAA family ATPase [Flavilitoribacter nigricans]|uniref:AAA+ ATPase domain-containing protein n=1 Tax=Flavilitoribacter nigricans (strain ATCC 23147 / DSM 23189 / NBRC 102662 / NCIMB 1420 / SS-2) TaxID=1122177 RepID=A0A2D0NED7_FLAN2|nr:AAA family ATPase [Flavilitoribacter nigricans]PHN06736.1 hypothetical protein CRP01_10610 [Flavilitoribacter nigricans DSM 23189 = NBRC 102662]
MAKENNSSAARSVAYWLFQSNFKTLRLRDALRAEALFSFPVRAHTDRIRSGDKVIIWQTGKAQGCYALATVLSDPTVTDPLPEEMPYYREAVETEARVTIRIDYNLWNRPVTAEMLQAAGTVDSFYAGLSGTNYRATEAQFESIASLVAQQDILHEPETEYFINPGFYPPLNLILHGPPGTGKTFRTINHAVAIIENRPLEEVDLEPRTALKKRFDRYQEAGRIDFVTFHQSFAYEDFIEGIKPVVENDQVNYRVEAGIFQKLCRRAAEKVTENAGDWDSVPRFVLIIDEINRGNLPAIFGELISLIEPNKRDGCAEQLRTILPYSKKAFSVPANLYLLGTMNTADRSTESLDIALRRRFSFLEVPSDHTLISELAERPMVAGVDLERLLQAINDRMEALLDEQARIGHAYFLQIRDLDDLRGVFELHILPLLKEYFYHDLAKIGLILGRAFIQDERNATTKFANFDHPYAEEMLHKQRFRLKPVQELEERDFIRIYDPEY